jgi:alanine racemase
VVRGERPTVATIRLPAIRANFAAAAALAGGREVIAVIKADAYGHGASPVARALVEAGCRRLAVVTVAEAAELRDAGVGAPILVLGGVHDESEAGEAIARGLVPVIHHAGHAQLLATCARQRGGPVPAHVEVDTGMRRMGVPPEEAPELLEAVAADPHLALEGVYSHFARADEPDLAPSREQIDVFRRVLAAARARGVDPGAVHRANSAGLLAGKDLADELPEADSVRPGLMLYGVSPAAHFAVDLAPAMTLSSRVVRVRRVRAGEAVGYAATYRAARDTTVATLPVGYADGVLVSSSNRGRVLLGGRRAPIVGRVSMDFITIDAGDARVAIGDEAILFGEGQGTRLPVEEAAAAADTIAYELLVRVGARVPRVFEG